MPISLRFSPSELELVKKYARQNKTSVSDVVRKAILEKIEDEYDLALFYEAEAEFQKDPKTYTLEEVAKLLGLEDV